MGHSLHRVGWLGAAGLCAASAAWGAGCAVHEMAEEAWFQTRRSLRPTAGGYRDDAEEVTEDWSEVRELGRRDQKSVNDDPAWYRKYFMSEMSRDIERNLGYE